MREKHETIILISMYLSFLFAPPWFPHTIPCDNRVGGEVGVDYVDVIGHEAPIFRVLVGERRWGGITPQSSSSKGAFMSCSKTNAPSPNFPPLNCYPNSYTSYIYLTCHNNGTTISSYNAHKQDL